MRRYTYAIHIEPAAGGGYLVTVPSLPGCITEGNTYEEAIANAREAIEGFVGAVEKAGEPIPVQAGPTRPFDALVRVEPRAVA